MQLDDYLHEKRLSAAEFARRLGVTESAVSRWLSRQSRPSLDHMVDIEKFTEGVVAVRDWLDGEAAA